MLLYVCCSSRHQNAVQLFFSTACWSWSCNSSQRGIRWRSLLVLGGCSAKKVRQASPDYITAFILTNGISWWGILRVMGIKIPGIAPTCHLPSGAQQICYTCCCGKLYIYRKRAKQTRVWSPLTAGSPGGPSCTQPLRAQVQHFCLSTPLPS